MRRKLILHGPSTLTLSLPISWVRQHGLSKGDEVDVAVVGSSLSVSVCSAAFLSCSCDVSSFSAGLVSWVLFCLHKLGYAEISLRCLPAQVSLVQKCVSSSLLGYEIVEVSSLGCVIKSVASEDSVSFDVLFRRVFLVTLGFSSGVCERVAAVEFSSFSELLLLEETVNRLTGYLHRLLNLQFSSHQRPVALYLLSWLQESIADQYVEICAVLADLSSVSSEVGSLFSSVHGLLDALYTLFYQFSFSAVEDLLGLLRGVDAEVVDVLALDLCAAELRVVFLLGSVVRYVDDSVGSVVAYHQ